MAHSTNQQLLRIRGGAAGVWIVALALAVMFTSSAAAGEPGFYSGGRFHPLIVSEDEYVVEFESPQQRGAVVQTMRAGAVGTLEEIPWGRNDGRFAILRTSPESVSVRSRVREIGGIRSIHPVMRTRPGGLPILPSGRIVVRVREDLTEQDRVQLLEDFQLDLVGAVDGLTDTYIVAPAGDMVATELDTAAALYRDDRTVYAHPDLRLPMRARQFGSDPFFNQQWYLENNGTIGDAVADADIDVSDAWARTFGTGIRVGQLDDSCDLMHEDLVDNYIGISHNISNNEQSATAANPQEAGDRHGTATMGIMTAGQFNGIGIRGVAPFSQFTASGGLLAFTTTSQVASAYAFARNQNVDVHNNSWGFVDAPNPDVVVDAIHTAFEEGRGGLGMVICFASGNGAGMSEDDPTAVEVFSGEELATLPTVIGVGASNARDVAAVYSNFGVDIDLMAPSNDLSEEFNLPAVVTTDNTDGAFIEPGFNNAGQTDDGGPNLADPSYTNNFGGTSAASPQVAGTAALILALASDFTATQVMSVIEHTCDKINPSIAAYDGITSRSLRYGYGRLNAGAAVEAVFDGFFWPRRVADVEVVGNSVRWKIDDDIRTIGGTEFGVRTVSVLVVQDDQPFSWKPTDGQTYMVGSQLVNEMGQPISAQVVANLNTQLFNFTPGDGTLYFGIYTVAQTQRRGLTYGFGVAVDSDGNVTDSGTTMPSDGGNGDGGLPPGGGQPKVSISVTPLFGTSPLTVSFMGNAQSSVPIESFHWDFGDGSTANTRLAQHTYTVPSGSQRFLAVLTVTDVNGQTGTRAVAIDVVAPGSGGNGGGQTGSLGILISDPAIPGSDIGGEGIAPLSVILSAQVSGVSFAALDSPTIFWDLGDGNIATSLSVAHTYQLPGRFPITATVESPSLAAPLKATRFIDVLTSTSSPTPTPTATPGNGGSSGGFGCGIGAVMALWCTLFGMIALRRLR